MGSESLSSATTMVVRSLLIFALPLVGAFSSPAKKYPLKAPRLAAENESATVTQIDPADFDAESWTVHYGPDGSKLVLTRNPKTNTLLDFYSLNQRNSPPLTEQQLAFGKTQLILNSGWKNLTPGDLPPPTNVSIPLESFMVLSTTTIPFLEMLNEDTNLKAYGGDAVYVSSGCLRDRLPASNTPESVANPFVGTGFGDKNLSATTPVIGSVQV